MRTLACCGWLTPLMLGGALWLGTIGLSARADDDHAALKPGAVDTDLLMFWHDRAFGQARLAIARKDKDAAAQHAWLLSQMADLNARQRDDAQYTAWAGELKKLAVDTLTAVQAEDWEKAKVAATAANDTCKKCHDVHAKEEG